MKNIFCVFSLAIALFCASCTSVESKKSEDVVYMGVILPFCDNAKLAMSIYDAMNLAVADVNASADKMAGKELRLKVYSDGNSEAQTGNTLVQMLESSEEICHVALRDPVIYFRDELASSKKFINYLNDYAPATLQGANSLRIYVGANQICEEMAKIIDKKRLEEKGELRVVAIGTENLMTRSAISYLKFELGSPQIKFYDEYFIKGESNFDILAEHIQSLNADYIFVFSSGTENADILNALNKFSPKAKVVFSSTKRGGLAQVGSYFDVAPEFYYGGNENFEAFAKRYRDVYAKALYGYEAVFAYDSIILSAKAYNANAGNMREFFLSKSLEGTACSYEFDSTGDSKIKLKSSFNMLE